MSLLIAGGAIAVLFGARKENGLFGLGLAMLATAAGLALLDTLGTCSALTGAEWIRACG